MFIVNFMEEIEPVVLAKKDFDNRELALPVAIPVNLG